MMRIDTIIDGARIHTLDPERPHAGRIGIEAGRIVGFDGDLDGISARHVVDGTGLVMTPGFIDAHVHTAWFGLSLQAVDVSQLDTYEDVYAAIQAAADNLPLDAWVEGVGLYPPRFGGQPDIRRLDQATGGRPLCLRHNSGHALTANTQALRLAGFFAPGFQTPDHGAIPIGDDGHPTGLVDEAAQELVQDLVRPYPTERLSEALAAATAQYAREGLTSFTDAGVGSGWIGHSPMEAEAYQRCAERGRLLARAQLMPTLDSLGNLTGARDDRRSEPVRGITLGVRSGWGSDQLSFGPTKVFMDGSLLGETAAMTEALCAGSHSLGHLADYPDQLRDRVRAAYRAGWAVAIHAIGDRAVDVALGMIEGCVRDYGHNALPNRIEHAGITRPDQLSRLVAAGLGCVTPQAAFLRPFGDQMLDLVGSERAGWLYRGRSFLDAGIPIAGSSDRPVVPGRPLDGMQQSIDRLSVSGAVIGPGEQLTPMEALLSHTRWAATATGRGHLVGHLAHGMAADLVLLDDDPLTTPDLSRIGVVATLMNGRITHGADSVPGARCRRLGLHTPPRPVPGLKGSTMTDLTYRLPQHRELVTTLPGPLSEALTTRRDAVVATGVASSSPFYIVESDGGIVVDADGNRVIDLGAGIAVVSVGASAPKVVENVTKAVGQFTHSSFATTPYESYVRVAELLAELTPGGFAKKSVLVNSGAEAVENAVKIARHYTGRAGIAVAENAFHGRTNLTMGLTTKAMPYKVGFGPFPSEIYRFPMSYPFREPTELTGQEAAARAIDHLETTIGAKSLACLIIEPIQGEGGFIVPAPGYLTTLQHWCTDNGIVFVADEIQAGFCRTGRWFASEFEKGLVPDLVTTAKALGGGLPLGAVTGRAEIMDHAQPGGLGGTFGGNPVSCAAAIGAVETMREWDLCARAQRIERQVRAALEPLVGSVPIVGELRGRGAMMALEFVAPGSRQPNAAAAKSVAQTLLGQGVITLTCGIHGNCVRLLPPLTIPESLLDEALGLLAAAVQQA